jgi:predicted nucleic acid-binding protein
MAGVYLESTVISYLAARPSRDLIVAAHQRLTQDWWTSRRRTFELFVSSLVIQEIGMGDPGVAARRLDLVAGIPLLEVDDEELELAKTLMREGAFPAGSDADALHVAIASANGLDYLLTWNMAHIANAELRPKIERACRRSGYEPPVLAPRQS